MKKWTIIMMIAVMTVCLVGCGTQKISLKEHITISVEGYNGYGSASLVVDEEKIDELVEQEKIDAYIKKITGNTMGVLLFEGTKFSDLIDFEIVGETTGLSNSDIVTVIVEIDGDFAFLGETLESMQEELQITIEDTEFQMKVDELEEAKVLDVMSFIDEYIVYSGANGGGKASIKFPKEFVWEKDGFSVVKGTYTNSLVVIKDHKNIASLNYYCDNKEYLSEGDELYVYVDCDSIELGETGYIINIEKKVKVPDLGNYLSTKDELTIDLKEKINEAVIKKVDRDNLIFHKYYFGTIKSATVTNNINADSCRIFVLASFENSVWGTRYRLCEISTIIQLPDNTYSFYVDETMITSDDPYDVTDEEYDLEEISW